MKYPHRIHSAHSSHPVVVFVKLGGGGGVSAEGVGVLVVVVVSVSVCANVWSGRGTGSLSRSSTKTTEKIRVTITRRREFVKKRTMGAEKKQLSRCQMVKVGSHKTAHVAGSWILDCNIEEF